jgi:hypothetical protein
MDFLTDIAGAARQKTGKKKFRTYGAADSFGYITRP